MEIVFNREKLLSAFKTAALAAPTRSPEPITENIKLEVTRSNCQLTATDGSGLSIRVQVSGAEVNREGICLLPAKQFLQVLSSFTDERLKLTLFQETSPAKVTLQSDGGVFQIETVSSGDFPNFTDKDAREICELPVCVLKTIFERTLFATSEDSMRYALSGVLLEFAKNKIIAVGTCGRRMAIMNAPVIGMDDQCVDKDEFIVHAATIGAFLEALKHASNDEPALIAILKDTRQVFFYTSNMEIRSRILEGRFPLWRNVIPKLETLQFSTEISAGRLATALQQTLFATTDESRGIEIGFDSGNLILSKHSPIPGQMQITIPLDTYSVAIGNEKPIAIYLDPVLVLDFIKTLNPSKIVTLELRGDDTIATFKTDDGSQYLLMPMQRT